MAVWLVVLIGSLTGMLAGVTELGMTWLEGSDERRRPAEIGDYEWARIVRIALDALD